MTSPREPGWHPEPENPATLQRYHDGTDWTDESRPVFGAAPPPSPEPGEARRRLTAGVTVAVVIGVGALVLLLLLLLGVL